MNKVWTISSALNWTRAFLKQQGIDSPLFEAQVLLAHVLGLTRIELLTQSMRPLDVQELAVYKGLIVQRARKRVPLAYLTGKKAFWNFELAVGPAVLIPRPDTECLVEEALRFLKSMQQDGQDAASQSAEHIDHQEGEAQTLEVEEINPRQAYYADILAREAEAEALSKGEEETKITDKAAKQLQTQVSANVQTVEHKVQEMLRIVDVGTGSGAIALALASELTPASREIWATDISKTALEVAKENAQKLELTENLHFLCGDLLAPFVGKADLIVSNPPYVTTGEYEGLEPELRHEPQMALTAGSDGLDIYRRLVVEAAQKLKDNGALIVEIGYTQAEAVKGFFAKAGFSDLKVVQDYGRKDRVVSGILKKA